MQSFFVTPIPSLPMPQTDKTVSDESGEKLVDIYIYSNQTIKVDMQYAKATIESAITRAYVRETVAKKLTEAKKLLPKGYTFEIFDAWRPYDVQLNLYNSYRRKILASMPGDTTEEEIRKKVCEFVSFPDKKSKTPFVHSTGGAVDLTILNADGKRLNMGTEFDDFSKRSYTAWYEENVEDTEIRNNRRLLYSVLSQCGFTNYPSEWWHYDFGDAFWGFYTGKKAIYKSKFDLI